MALPYIVNKLEDIEEAHRGLYTEKDGKFVLDVGGLPEPKTDAQTAKELAAAIRKQSDLEKDLHKARESKNAEAAAKAELEAKLEKQRSETREILKKAGLIDDGKDSDGDADLRKRIEAIEEQKRTERFAAIESERDSARKEVAVVRALAGKVEDVDYAIYRAQRLDAWNDVKVEDGKIVGIDELMTAMAEAGLITADDDDDEGDKDQKTTPPEKRGQPKLSDAKRPWKDARNWLDFLAMPTTVQEQARAKDPDWVKTLERKHFGNL